MERYTKALEGSLWSWQLDYISGSTHRQICAETISEMFFQGSPNVTVSGDDVSATLETGELYLSASFTVKIDSMRGEAYVSGEGTVFCENIEDGHLICEDITIYSEVIERELPDVEKQRRDAAKERRARRKEYRNMVL